MKISLFLACYFLGIQAANAMDLSKDSLKVSNLPLIVTSTSISDNEAPVALLISGDGGWYHFEQSIANDLAKKGIPTVGLDSRKYFWQRHTPDQTASEIGMALNYYASKWGRSKFLLIGYSLGAEIVPFIVNRLPDDLKQKVGSVVLLSPATTTDFEIHITNMMGIGNHNNTYKTIPEITSMNVLTLIIFGDGENTPVPGLLSGTSVIVRKIPGDHHYKFNVPLIVEVMNENKTF
jgi:type IV secretory pathway VirJ component